LSQLQANNNSEAEYILGKIMGAKEYSHVGVVIIGRNEGDRLKACLESVLRQAAKVVYVDSGSSDESVEYAESLEVCVVALDMSIPFSAGRARNEGFRKLLNDDPDIQYVQFIDGDCTLADDWIAAGLKYMDDSPAFSIVSGRRKEIHPEDSVYNLLCDIEWDTPVGEADSCGGDFLVKVVAFQSVGGFNPDVIAGEEPELCYRLRHNGGSIQRIAHLMTFHDASIVSFGQWWKRTVRSGHAYAHCYALHREGKEKFCFVASLRIWLWALIIPLLIVFLMVFFDNRFGLLVLLYPVSFFRIFLNVKKRLDSWKDAALYAFFTVIGKWPQLFGQFIFMKRVIRDNEFQIIEY